MFIRIGVFHVLIWKLRILVLARRFIMKWCILYWETNSTDFFSCQQLRMKRDNHNHVYRTYIYEWYAVSNKKHVFEGGCVSMGACGCMLVILEQRAISTSTLTRTFTHSPRKGVTGILRFAPHTRDLRNQHYWLRNPTTTPSPTPKFFNNLI